MDISVKTVKAPRQKPQNKKSVKKERIIVKNPEKGTVRNRPQKLKGILPNLTQAYFDSLVAPWENQGVKLGWGCMTHSDLATAYLRGTTTANADGTLAIAVLPCAKNFVWVANGGTGANFATAATSLDATDLSSISTNYRSGRVISAGIKCFPSIAATAAPGVAYSGCLEPLTSSDLSVLTPSDLISFPSNRQEIATLGASATGRPFDPTSFEFRTKAVNTTGFGTPAAADGTQLPFTAPYVVFSGLPASSPVAYEAAVNFECTYATTHSNASIGGESKAFDATLADDFPSADSMWRKVSHYLPTPGQAYEATSSILSNRGLIQTLMGGAQAYAGHQVARNAGRLLRFGPN
jgi:hypothetical protein